MPPGQSPVDAVLTVRLMRADDHDTLTVVITVHRVAGERVDPEATQTQVNSAVAAATRTSGLQPAGVQVMAYLSRAIIHAHPPFLRALLRQPEVMSMALTDPSG